MGPNPLDVDLLLPRRGETLFAERVGFGFAQDAGILGLCGPSGSGKTTIMRIVAGLSFRASGRVSVDGECWFDSSQGVALPFESRSVAYLPQGASLFPHMNVRENLVFAARLEEGARLRKRSSKTRLLDLCRSFRSGTRLPGWAEEIIEIFGVSGFLGKGSRELSGGEVARIALARCFLRSARVYLLDEPFSGLDPESRFSLGQTLAGLLKRTQAMAILVTHTPDEICSLAQGMVRLFPDRDDSRTPARMRPTGRDRETGSMAFISGGPE